MKNFKYKNIQLRYQTHGEADNPAVVLLHGYLESLEIWDNFALLLKENYFVICPDIPGHGKSGNLSTTHTMEELAEAVRDLMLFLKVKEAHIVGHSMGGYVALAFADLYDEYINTCVLFHSSCFEDTEEKRANRNREIDLLRSGKKDLIVNTNIPKGFADSNLEELSDEVDRAKSIALASDEEGVIAILNGMKLRPDRSHILEEGQIPFLLIAGKKDNYIPFEAYQKVAALGSNLKFEVLDNSGHMGFIEEKEKSASILKEFFEAFSDQ